MTKRPDDPTLNKLLRHVAYERVAMTVAHDRFKKTGDKSVPLFESLLVHARNGYAFLYKKRGGKDGHPNDIFAEDYVAGWSATPSGGLGQAYRRMHVQVTHLSSERVKRGNSYRWTTWTDKLPRIVNELDAEWERFRNALDGSRRSLFAKGMNDENRRLRGRR